MGLFRKVNEREKARMIEEAFDPNKLQLLCKQHMYAGNGIPTENCRDCAQVWWMNWAAKLPPERRTDMIAEMLEMVKMACALQEKGQFDINLYRRPNIEIEKGKDN